SEFMKQDPHGGSCCVTALIRNGNLVVSNAGDCRAVISRGGVAEALTSDHRPSREDERERIETSGGYVDLCRGVWRIQGSLAVSRAIGDRHLKQWVTAEPETKVISIEPEYILKNKLNNYKIMIKINHQFIIITITGKTKFSKNQQQ
ncbi:hypothetical protein KIW84_UN0081, partial [Lathyrus oleraceus]